MTLRALIFECAVYMQLSHLWTVATTASGRIRIITGGCNESERAVLHLLDGMHCLVLFFQKIESWSTQYTNSTNE